MKLVKMSLAAAVLLGASAFAIDNVKVSGDAKLFYNTNDTGTLSLFDKDNSYADTALRLGVTGDLLKGVSFGVTGYAISTLGLENNLVSHVWEGTGADQSKIGEAWLAGTMGKTTVKVGRMELDTPLAFSEKWSIIPNTFDAAVLINQDLPDTTLVGAWVGKSNGSATTGDEYVVMAPSLAFSSFYQGAYAAAVVNNSFKPLTAQAWYYDVQHVANAYWLQADWDCQLVKGVKIGAQYADIDLKNSSADSSAYALKVAYAGVENLTLSAAYSDTDKDGALNVANIATTNTTSQSKLYTEAWWNYGYVGTAGAESFNVTAEYNAGFAKVGAYYTDVSNDIATSTHEMTELTVTASKSFGPLDTTLAYVSTDADDQNNGSQYNSVQAYLTLNF
ncbi:porin [Sulfuricurvum sp.]|uniref:porin n=1 Tax=Sulfuricurvum sp. TaxID=2025608 RepID=UPI003C4241F0